MATLQSRNGKWRAIVRRKGHTTQSRTFPTKTAAKTWADRIEREMADMDARGGTPGESTTPRSSQRPNAYAERSAFVSITSSCAAATIANVSARVSRSRISSKVHPKGRLTSCAVPPWVYLCSHVAGPGLFNPSARILISGKVDANCFASCSSRRGHECARRG